MDKELIQQIKDRIAYHSNNHRHHYELGNAYLNMCTTEEMNIVISALKKQIPKKPEQGTTNAFIYVCPNCGGPVGSLEVEEIWCDFCPKCGQAIDNSLDWSDEK